VSDPAALKNVAIFVGVGTADDLMLEPTRGLRERLHKAGVKQLEYREYAAAEHLTVDLLAFVDAFRFFDRVVQPSQRSD
jgi:hypothetical protein